MGKGLIFQVPSWQAVLGKHFVRLVVLVEMMRTQGDWKLEQKY